MTNEEYLKALKQLKLINYHSSLVTNSVKYVNNIMVCNLRYGWRPLIIDAFKQMIEAGWDRAVIAARNVQGVLVISIPEVTDYRYPPDVYRIVTEAKEKASHTCEICGNENDTVIRRPSANGTWWTVSCSDCHITR